MGAVERIRTVSCPVVQCQGRDLGNTLSLPLLFSYLRLPLTTATSKDQSSRAVITDVGTMHAYISEVETETFLREFVPGSDPSPSNYDGFYYPVLGELNETCECKVNLEIVRYL